MLLPAHCKLPCPAVSPAGDALFRDCDITGLPWYAKIRPLCAALMRRKLTQLAYGYEDGWKCRREWPPQPTTVDAPTQMSRAFSSCASARATRQDSGQLTVKLGLGAAAIDRDFKRQPVAPPSRTGSNEQRTLLSPGWDLGAHVRSAVKMINRL